MRVLAVFRGFVIFSGEYPSEISIGVVSLYLFQSYHFEIIHSWKISAIVMKITVHNLVANSHPPIKSGNGYQLDDERKTMTYMTNGWLSPNIHPFKSFLECQGGHISYWPTSFGTIVKWILTRIPTKSWYTLKKSHFESKVIGVWFRWFSGFQNFWWFLGEPAVNPRNGVLYTPMTPRRYMGFHSFFFPPL